MDVIREAIDLTLPEVPRPKGVQRPETSAETRERERKAVIVATGLQRYDIAVEAYREQVKEEIDDLEFEGGDQWPADLRKLREGGVSPSGTITPARPCLQFNKITPTINQVTNEAKQGRFSIEIRPKAGKATQEQAEVRQGLIRAIEVDSNAQNARMWALERAVKCGRGAYRILKVAANDGDFDLDLVVSRIMNQHSVWLDPFAQEADWADMEWGLITTDIPDTEFARRWPHSELNTADADKLKSLGDATPDWVSGDTDGKRTYRVAEYYYIEHEDRILGWGEQVGQVWMDQLPVPKHTLVTKQRRVDVRHVKWCIISAVDVLDEEEWEGRYIPIIPVVGNELNIAGRRKWKGIVNNAKDPQRSYNYMRSKQIEAIGLSSLAPWVMAEGQDLGYEKMWDEANTRAYTRLIYNPTSFEGTPLPPPRRDVAEPAIQAISQAVHEADGDIKATMGRFDPSLGQPGKERSGVAIKQLKVQGETGTSNYAENLTSLSMAYEGKVLNDMLEHVYDRPGRIAKMIGPEDDAKDVILNQAFTRQGGGLRPLDEGEPFIPGQHELYNLNEGQFGVVVSVGKNFVTRREEAAQSMTELATAWPDGVPLYADMWVREMDFPGSDAIADRIKANNPAAAHDDDENSLPPAAQAAVQQVQQQLALATQKVQELQQEVDTDAAKYRAMQDIKQAEIASTERIKGAELAAKERIAQLQAKTDVLLTQAKMATDKGIVVLKAQFDALAREDEQAFSSHEDRMAEAHERAATARAHQHERDTQETDAHHKSVEAGMSRAHDRASTQDDQRHEISQTARAQFHESREGQHTRAHETDSAERDRQHETVTAARESRDTIVGDAGERRAAAAAQALKQRHESTEAERDRQHADTTGAQDRRHEVAMTKAKQAHETRSAAAAHEGETEHKKLDAKLAPKPKGKL